MRVPVDERRQALAEAALRVLSRAGLAAATTRAIAAEAGLSLASVHYAYRSRDELLGEVVRLAVEQESAALDDVIPAGGAGRGRDALAALVRSCLEAYVASVVADPGREHGMLELTLAAARSDELRGVATLQYTQYQQLVERMLQAAAAATGIAWTVEVTDLARTIVAMTDGLTIAQIVDGRLPDSALDVLTAALVAAAEPAAR